MRMSLSLRLLFIPGPDAGPPRSTMDHFIPTVISAAGRPGLAAKAYSSMRSQSENCHFERRRKPVLIIVSAADGRECGVGTGFIAPTGPVRVEHGGRAVDLWVCGAGFPACHFAEGRLESLPHNPPNHLKSTGLSTIPVNERATLPAEITETNVLSRTISRRVGGGASSCAATHHPTALDGLRRVKMRLHPSY
jgi:hypothetical protein